VFLFPLNIVFIAFRTLFSSHKNTGGYKVVCPNASMVRHGPKSYDPYGMSFLPNTEVVLKKTVISNEKQKEYLAGAKQRS